MRDMLSPAEGTLCWARQCWGWGQLGWEGWEGQQQSVTSSVVPHPPALHPISLISTWPGSSVLLRVGCFPAWLGHNFELRRRNFGQNSTFCVGLRKAFFLRRRMWLTGWMSVRELCCSQHTCNSLGTVQPSADGGEPGMLGGLAAAGGQR